MLYAAIVTAYCAAVIVLSLLRPAYTIAGVLASFIAMCAALAWAILR